MNLHFVFVVLLFVCSQALGNPEWGSWKAFGKGCGARCDNGITESKPVKYKRTCSSGKNKDCPGEKFKFETCKNLKPCASWGEWIAKGKCSEKCGVGQQRYKRKCIRTKYPSKCPGDKEKYEPCNNGPCAIWGEWDDGECSALCGDGTMKQTRECKPGIGKCKGDAKRTVPCNDGPCDEDDCEPNPCKNGAECVDELFDYTCECKEGSYGDNCENLAACTAPTISGANTDCTASTVFGDSCTATCNTGHIMTGNPTLKCSDGDNKGAGKFTDLPTCAVTQCTSPSNVAGSTFSCTGNVNYGGICTLTCAAGYTGARTLTCNKHTAGAATSTWDNASPCTITQCASPSNVPGSTFSCTGNVNYGGKCSLTCDAGYAGTRTLTCNKHTAGAATSTWDNASPCTEQACRGNLGMKDRRIADYQISSSVEWMARFPSWQPQWWDHTARLHSATGWHGDVGFDPHRPGWLQIDLLKDKIVTGIKSQGRGDGQANWTTSYAIMYKLNGSNTWTTMPGVLPGNWDATSVRTNIFPKRIKARYVRVVVRGYNGNPVLRIELLGCY